MRPKRDLVGKNYKSKTEKQVDLPKVYKMIPKTERMVQLPKVYYSKALTKEKDLQFIYIASGAGLSPNINGLRFYDSGLTFYTNKVFYDETNTYAMWIHSGGYWIIGLIGLAGTLPPVNVFYKNIFTSGDPPTGSYSPASGYSGTVTISAI